MGTSYIRNLAQSIMGQLGVLAESVEGSGSYTAQRLYHLHGQAVYAQLRRMRPETLGKIAAAGRGMDGQLQLGWPMYKVHNPAEKLDGEHAWLCDYSDGLTILRIIACAAIIAEMAEILLPYRANP